MAESGCVDPFETVCRMRENDGRIADCNDAVFVIEQVVRLLSDLQLNRAFRDLDQAPLVSEWSRDLIDARGRIFWAKANLDAENGHLMWDLKYLKEAE